MPAPTMQQRFVAVQSNPRLILCLLMAILVFTVGGCAPAQKAYRFTAHSVTKVSYDPRRCTEQLDGSFKCKEVIFTVSSIEPKTK